VQNAKDRFPNKIDPCSGRKESSHKEIPPFYKNDGLFIQMTYVEKKNENPEF
jgi:hypothetical protein